MLHNFSLRLLRFENLFLKFLKSIWYTKSSFLYIIVVFTILFQYQFPFGQKIANEELYLGLCEVPYFYEDSHLSSLGYGTSDHRFIFESFFDQI